MKYLKYVLIMPPLLLCLAALWWSHRNVPAEIPAATETQRLQWLQAQGLAAEFLAFEMVEIPVDFSGNYADYAALQEMQEMPLADAAGKSGVLYTYQVADSEPPLYAELLTADGILVGVQCYRPTESRTLTLWGEVFTADGGDS